MIITRLLGGLGNQMFQFAAGLAAARRCYTYLKCDISAMSRVVNHQGFEMQRVFEVNAPLANAQDVHEILGWQRHLLAQRILKKSLFNSFSRPALVQEPTFEYWQGFDQLRAPAYLAGNWQSPKYFESIESEVRQVFQFIQVHDAVNAEMLKVIDDCNSVSIHVRRGDYVTQAKNRSIYAQCGLAYYKMAVSRLLDNEQQARFFVFSDDPGWVLQNLELPDGAQIVDHNRGAESYRDMQLMSRCKHNITANSTFSWWGAWLNSNPEKQVITPAHWFLDDKATSDLLPSTWIQL